MRTSDLHVRARSRSALAYLARGVAFMAQTAPLRLILASGSPARRELLKEAGYAFEVKPANVDEPTGEGFHDPRAFVQYTAWLKAAAVAQTINVTDQTPV